MFGSRTLFVTNVVSSGVMMGFGDWIVQHAAEKTDKNRQKTDWARTGSSLSRYFFIVSVSSVFNLSAYQGLLF